MQVDRPTPAPPLHPLDTARARTHPVPVNLTLSLDEALAERARDIAAGRGKSREDAYAP